MDKRQSKDQVTGNGNALSGYAVLYGVASRELYEHGRKFTEVIERGAFDLENNGEHDVKLYFNHDTSQPLARTKGGSLRLWEDEKGIRFEANLPETTLAKDVRELMDKGILTGEMSFGFVATRDRWSKGQTFRTVQKATLYEISLVVDAAYTETSSQLRSETMNEITQRRINLLRRRKN